MPYQVRQRIQRAIVCTAMFILFLPPSYGQDFTLITEGPVATDGRNNFGAAWVDVDNDGDLDLYVANAASQLPNFLYLNNGDGTFTKVEDSIILNDPHTTIGTCWADYDNDGDLDVYNAGIPNSFLYRNDGDVIFTKITNGDIGGNSDNRGFSCSWADFDENGFVDLFIAAPNGFGGIDIPNTLFKNNRDDTFTRITDSPIVTGLSSYTEGNWTDYDDDGDLDLFIGSGPANGTLGPDFLYRNLLTETGSATFERIMEAPLANDRDGQTWNFIDYDNDGDLDGFVTNYSGFANELYENQGDGAFVQITEGALVTDATPSLANVWGDYDNDGDLDVFIANEAGSDNVYYRNELMETGAATFTRTGDFDDTKTGNYGATAGDYDNDGDLDLFVASHSGGGHKLYRNEKNNGTHWLKLKLIGTTSNRAGVGGKVTATAMIGGQAVTLRREVSTQNTFNGHNSLNVHLGLGDATVVDEIRIEWPSGTVDVVNYVKANTFYVAIENQGLVTLVEHLLNLLKGRVDDLVVAGTLNNDQGNALKAKLSNAIKKHQQGKSKTVANMLKAYQNQFSMYLQAGILTDKEGRALLDPSTTVLTLLGDNAAKQSVAEVRQELDAKVPLRFELEHNYPDPFNPSTTIAYTLSENSHVILKIYDMQGRVVEKLVENWQAAGRYTVRWKAPQGLASGAYLYRLEADASSQTKALYLLK